MVDAILTGLYVGACIGASIAALLNCEAYQNQKAEQEAEQRTVYTFGDVSGITTSADAELPEIVIAD